MTTHQFYASCPKGLESLLFTELQQLLSKAGLEEKGEGLRETIGGVYFSGDLAAAYRVCLWSRLANKILLPLKSIDIGSEKDLYNGVVGLPWEDHLQADGSFKVDFIGTNDSIRNSQFGAVRIKDAIVDSFRQQFAERPSINKDKPDLVINARLTKGRAGRQDKVHLSIDLSGQSLHRRGYRTQQGVAPLKENIAAALLLRAKWPDVSKQGGALVDPMCGSATLLVEGVLMAADIAPGLLRQHWGFTHWKAFEPSTWQILLEEAKLRRKKGIEKLQQQAFEARGYDHDSQVLRAAESNIALAGLSEFIRISVKEVDELKKPSHKAIYEHRGLIICNPPYGERLGDEQALLPVYRQLGGRFKEEFLEWKAAVFTANTKLAKNMGVRAHKIYKFFNGSLATDLLCFDLQEKSFVKPSTLAEDEQNSETNTERPLWKTATPTFEKLTPGAQMVCNRLKKNKKQLANWLKKSDIECYRLYDADMPEYAAAIDCYGQWVHVQEYAAPKTVDEKKAQYRFDELLSAIPVALAVEPEQLFIKQRRRNKGIEQYQRLEGTDSRALIPVTEPCYRHQGGGGPDQCQSQATCLVNLWSYLDSGLFLDHRPVRQMLAQMASGKSFLNLFCYTATATVHAALGGAVSSVSVDMSNTYLKWAEENFSANHINSERHKLVQQDCIRWLEECRQGFDLILLDPPSFSNSKRMDDVFDVQRDHRAIIHRCMELLRPQGTLIFSNNLRTFALDAEISKAYCVNNITEQTLDPDFQRNRKIHQCFLITA